EDEDFKKRKELVETIANKLNANFDTERVKVNLYDQYYNMKKVIEKDMTPITIAEKVMKDLNIKPIIEPIR
ncbi:peptidase T, partial [Streptococcus suis]